MMVDGGRGPEEANPTPNPGQQPTIWTHNALTLSHSGRLESFSWEFCPVGSLESDYVNVLETRDSVSTHYFRVLWSRA